MIPRPIAGACFLGAALICGLLVGGAGFGQSCVQESAYGDERRFLLRPPAAFLLPVTTAALARPQPEPLATFHPLVRRWFAAKLGEASAPQVQGWPLIRAGRDVLIAAPTGSGKTLTAFLACLDELTTRLPLARRGIDELRELMGARGPEDGVHDHRQLAG